MDKKNYYLTKEGFENLKKEYENIKKNDKPAALERVKRARDLGELEDNQEYDVARDAQNVIEGRLLEIEDILRNCKIIEEVQTDGVTGQIALGSTVTVEVKGTEQTFTIVGSVEADPSRGKVSHESPVGSRLIGLKEGDIVKIELPHANVEYKIRKIHY